MFASVDAQEEDAWVLEKGFTYFTEAVQRKATLEQEQKDREIRAAVTIQCRWHDPVVHKIW